MQKVVVLMGGVSSEREISLASGQAVTAGLREAGYQVTPLVLDTPELGPLPPMTEAVFIALHGGYGENGGVQAELDRRQMPYSGPGALASRQTMDKIITKQILVKHQIPTPRYEVLEERVSATNLELPLVVKPPRDGSSMGISKVTSGEQLQGAIDKARALELTHEVLVEEYIPGREWTVGIVAGTALPVLEIVTPDEWYGFEEKYSAGRSNYVFPASADDRALAAQCQVLALLAFEALGCRGVTRVDFRISPAGRPYILELNTSPGFTATSLLPKAAQRAGIGFSQLCDRIMRSAKCD